MNFKENKRIDFLDGFRGFACLLVMMHHSLKSLVKLILEKVHLSELYYYASSFTQSGVEIFFVLSGFVLTYKYFLNQPINFNVIQYFKRRFLRIYPPFLAAWLIACVVIYANTGWPTWYSAVLVKFDWKTALGFLYMFRLKSDYYNLAWWSLQIELVFYFMVPFIFFGKEVIKKNSRLKWFYVTIIIVLSLSIQYITALIFPDYYSMDQLILSTFMFFNYVLCFFMGVSIAAAYWKSNDLLVMIPLGLAFVIVSKFTYYSFANIGYGLIYGGVIVVMLSRESFLTRFFEHKNLIWFGERSYSFFLTHFSVFYLSNYFVSHYVEERNIWYGLFSRIIGWTLSFVIGILVFELVEKRFTYNLKTGNKILPV